MGPPLGRLAYLYVGSGKFVEDLEFYQRGLGASLLWNLEGFGAKVAALRFAAGPLLLLADHRPAPSVLPVYEAEDLDAFLASAAQRGVQPDGSKFEIPNGPCILFRDPSGNQFAVFQNERPEPFGPETPESSA